MSIDKGSISFIWKITHTFKPPTDFDLIFDTPVWTNCTGPSYELVVTGKNLGLVKQDLTSKFHNEFLKNRISGKDRTDGNEGYDLDDFFAGAQFMFKDPLEAELWVLGSGVPVMMMFRGKLLKPT